MRRRRLRAAWARVRANGGAAGVDGESIERFAARSERYLAELSTALRDGEYRPQPVKRVEIPKGDGRTRPLGIPAVKDRIVQTAMKLVIEPIFEATFRPTSYGFRPGRGCHDALREVDRLIKEGSLLRGGCRPQELLRQHPARAADAAGGGADQRRSRPRTAARLARAGHSAGHGAMDAKRRARRKAR